MQQLPDIIETDLTEEEKDIVRQGRKEYKKAGSLRLRISYLALHNTHSAASNGDRKAGRYPRDTHPAFAVF